MMKKFARNRSYYLEGGCASFAIALHQLLKLPLYVMKFKSKNGLDTHIFVYDKKKKLGIDADGYFNPKEAVNFLLMRKITLRDLKILGKLHLIPVTSKSIQEAKNWIKVNKFLEWI